MPIEETDWRALPGAEAMRRLYERHPLPRPAGEEPEDVREHNAFVRAYREARAMRANEER